MSVADLVRKMQEDQKRVLEQVWARRASDLPLHSPYELLTLASIVEKETGKADERPRVAGVFMNRLQKRMRLQSDPTIVYGLVGGRGTLGRSITRAEVDKPTLYNTYTIDGLPPGPIANPGRAALEAVANPSRTQDLYFVADGTGGHVFAESLEQHNRNVQRWRQIEKEKEKSGPDIDKFTPQTAPVRGDQRGELNHDGDFGALSFAPENFAQQSGTSLGIADVEKAIARVAPKMPVAAASAVANPSDAEGGGKASKGKKQKSGVTPATAFAVSPGLDELGITVRGIGPGKAAADLLDGPVNTTDQAPAAEAANQAVFAVSTARRAEIKAKAEKLGLDPGSDTLPPNVDSNSNVQSAQPAPPAQAPAAPQKLAHAKIIDVSEGTALDPLLDHTYDLNYPKTVPSTTSSK
jgi:UPF0755 protein